MPEEDFEPPSLQLEFTGMGGKLGREMGRIDECEAKRRYDVVKEGLLVGAGEFEGPRARG